MKKVLFKLKSWLAWHVTEPVKEWLGRMAAFGERHSTVLFLIGLTAAVAVLLYVGFRFFVELSVFAVVLAMFAAVLVLGILTDRFILTGIDTLKELKDGNVAVAIALLALAVLFFACTSFV